MALLTCISARRLCLGMCERGGGTCGRCPSSGFPQTTRSRTRTHMSLLYTCCKSKSLLTIGPHSSGLPVALRAPWVARLQDCMQCGAHGATVVVLTISNQVEHTCIGSQGKGGWGACWGWGVGGMSVLTANMALVLLRCVQVPGRRKAAVGMWEGAHAVCQPGNLNPLPPFSSCSIADSEPF